MSSSDALSVGSSGRYSLSGDPVFRASVRRLAELVRLLCDSHHLARSERARDYRPATAEAATQTDGPEQEPSESSLSAYTKDATVWVQGPKWNPTKLKCMYCKERGHKLGQCPVASAERVRKSHQYCSEGWHSPYLHGVWRCTNCCEHLQSKLVRQQQPDYYFAQARSEWAKVQKYGSPFE